MRIPLPLSGRTFFVVFGAVFLCAGLILFSTGMQEAMRERAYRERGQVVEAVVVGKSITRASREGPSSTRYEIAYRFRTADGRTAEGVDTVGVEEWERLDPGSPFTITYLPGAPESSRAEDAGGPGSSLIVVGLGGLLGLIGGGVVAWAATRIWRDRRLLRQGVAVEGTVVAIVPSNVAVNRVRQWQVRYRYRDHLGRTQEGTSGSLSPEDAHVVAVGDALTVRFDRQRPEESIWDRAGRPVVARSAEGSAETRARSPLRTSPVRRVGNVAAMLGLFFVAMVVGESVPALKDLERLMARHQVPLLAFTIGLTVVGFVLFMGGILHRIFGAGGGEPMTHGDVEDLARSVRMEARPVFARVTTYRFRGRSAGSAVSDAFTVREAKDAWRQRAWRGSPRWRANFAVMAGVMLLVPGLFGIFIVIGPSGIKLLCGAALVYAAARSVAAFARA